MENTCGDRGGVGVAVRPGQAPPSAGWAACPLCEPSSSQTVIGPRCGTQVRGGGPEREETCMGSHSTGGINHFLLQLEALRTPTAQPQMWPYSLPARC